MNTMIRAVLLGLLACITCTVQAADEIKLQDARSFVAGRFGVHRQSIWVEAVVKDLGPDKRVHYHHRLPDGRWTDVPMTFERTAGPGLEVWSLRRGFPNGTLQDQQFALRYEVNGQTFWDSNGGANHFLGHDDGTFLAPGVMVDLMYPADDERATGDRVYRNAVSVRNVAFAKDVTIIYSTDGWASVRSKAAQYSPEHYAIRDSGARIPNVHGVEVWSFSADLGTADEIEFAIRYTVNGQTHWDNNLGANYRVKIAGAGDSGTK